MRSTPFQVKICGIATARDAELCAEAGADAIGLNLHPPSVRSVSLETARNLCELELPLKTVAVCVNRSAEELLDLLNDVSVDYVQLHGDESIDLLRELPADRVIRALRCPDRVLQTAREFLDDCRRHDCLPAGLLIDGYSPTAYGGTGARADWQALEDWREWSSVPLILAGGLTPENVGEAIAQVAPSGVDTASGVESAPGSKSADRIRGFVETAQKALRAGGE